MESFKARTASIVTLGLVLMTLVSGFVFMKIADSAPPVHCEMHGQAVTCAAARA
jgi:hypothetical protein